MAPLPSAIRGNLVPTSENLLLRPPSFEKYFKSSHHTQIKPLQVERRFSHYEQKIATAPVEGSNRKIPRRLQTRKVERPSHKQSEHYFDESRITWNPRLAAWIYGDQMRSVQYIKICDPYNIIEKQLYYCSACHEFFHVNLHPRKEREVTCPRFNGHHEDHEVHPVSVKKLRTKKKDDRRKRPPTSVKAPFANRERITIPSLLPPKPLKKTVRVIVEMPRLPNIPKAEVKRRPNNVAKEKEKSPTPEKCVSHLSFTSTENIERSISSKLPHIFQTQRHEGECRLDESPLDTTYKVLQTSTKTNDTPSSKEADTPTETVDQRPTEAVKDEDNTSEPEILPPDPEMEDEENDVENEDGREVYESGESNYAQCISVEIVEKFDEVASNAMSDFCDLEDSDRLQCGDVTLEEAFSDNLESDEELYLPSVSSASCEEVPESPTRPRPRPPPPDLPVIRLEDSPDIPKRVEQAKQEKRRKSVFLPTIQPDKIAKPKIKQTKPEPRFKFTKEEIAKRMNRVKEIDGYRKKYETDVAVDYETSENDEDRLTPPEVDLYDDSFLEKYCLVSPDHLMKSKRIFEKIDEDEDGYLTCEEVIHAMHKMYSPTLLDDAAMCYIFRILETTSFDIFAEKMNLKLFAIVTALADKISKLERHMKHLIGRVNVEVVDWKLCQAKQMFEQTMQKDGHGKFTMPMESLWLELKTGGISDAHQKQARRTLKHLKEMDVLDFFTYLPLFLFVHTNVVNNPLNDKKHM